MVSLKATENTQIAARNYTSDKSSSFKLGGEMSWQVLPWVC